MEGTSFSLFLHFFFPFFLTSFKILGGGAIATYPPLNALLLTRIGRSGSTSVELESKYVVVVKLSFRTISKT